MKFTHHWQLEEKDCGPTCLRMISKYYGKEISINQIRNLCNTTKLGTFILDLKAAGEELGFKSILARGKIESMLSIELPVILVWHPAHFVILYKISKSKSKRYYHIADPAFGKIKLLEEVFRDSWEKDGKGMMLFFESTDKFYNLEIKEEKRKNTLIQLWEMYKGYVNKYKGKISWALVLTFIGVILSWFAPFLFRMIVDNGITNKDLSIVNIILIFQFVIVVGNFLSKTFSSILFMQTNFQVGVQILSKYLYKIIELPVSIFTKKQMSDFVVRLEDISRIQNFMTQNGINLFLQLINIIVFSCLLFYFNHFVFAITFTLLATGILWTTFFIRKRRSFDYELTRLQAENNLAIYEIINEMPEIKINNAQLNKIDQWAEIFKKQNKTILASLYLINWQTAGAHLFSTLSNVVVTAICAYSVINGEMTLGTMMSVSFIMSQLTSPIEQLVYLMRATQDVAISNERIQEIHQYKEENKDRSTIFQSLEKEIKIKNLSFKYPGSGLPWVLKNINLSIPVNSMTAIVGISGSGKTTLLKLLLGFYSPNTGEIYLDNTDLEKYNLKYFRDKIGVVMQNGHIFSSSVISNIAIADPNPDIERIRRVAKIACLDDFVERLPQKYNTKIGRNGIELSGGQKQRILIARALYKDPPILILDEATSALDANTEKAIVDNLDKEMQNRTVVIIAHRFSTIKSADQIVVLANGEIAEVGDHELLSQSNGEYFQLVKNQLNLN